MDKAVEVAKEDFATIRTGRANPAMFNKIIVDYYGSADAAAAARVVPDARGAHHPRHAVRQVVDGGDREGAARLRPRRQPDQRRQRHPGRRCRSSPRSAARSTSSSPGTRARTRKVSMRNIRRKAKDELDQLVKDGEVGEDEVNRAEKELEALTKKHVDSSTSCSSTRRPSCSRSECRSPHEHLIRPARARARTDAPGARHTPGRADARRPADAAARQHRPGRAQPAGRDRRRRRARRARRGHPVHPQGGVRSSSSPSAIVRRASGS